MSSHEFSIDQDVLAGFIDEALDDLNSVVEKLVNLKNHGYSSETVQALFRVFHSIKGNASYFSLFAVKDLSHSIEQVLDNLRQKKITFSDYIGDLLIEGANAVSETFEIYRSQGVGSTAPDVVVQCREDIRRFLESGSEPSGEPSEPAQIIAEIIKDLSDLEAGGTELRSLIKKYRTISGSALQVVLAASPDQPQEYLRLKSLFESDTDLPPGDPIFDEILSDIDKLKSLSSDEQFLQRLSDITDSIQTANTTIGLDVLIKSVLRDELKALPLALKTDAQDAKVNSQTVSSAKTMRISEEAVDRFLEFVGELVIVEDMYSNLTARAKAGSIERDRLVTELRKITETFSLLSRDLQKSIMEIRKVPIGILFKRMPKIVHEIASAKGKLIELRTEGDDLRVDKTILEKLESPLVHMVRNAADHGIETPDIRKTKDKAETGIISLSAQEIGGIVHVKISDDGAGLNLERLHTKAVELGIMKENELFDQQKIINTMFHSGVSTAESVTEISGRGVGMDVVKQNIEEAGGEILTFTHPDEGTDFVLKIPAVATTQIIHGFVVRTAFDRYILPLDSVEATISISGVHIESVSGRGHVLKFKDEVLSVTRLDDTVNLTGIPFSTESTDIVLILKHQSHRRAFVVSAVDGIRQVVKKQLDLPPSSMKAVTGAAIMGDGLVSLVLNMDNLFQ